MLFSRTDKLIYLHNKQLGNKTNERRYKLLGTGIGFATRCAEFMNILCKRDVRDCCEAFNTLR